MELDSTSKKRNFIYSLKKFILEELHDSLGILPIFDEFLPPEESQSEWIFVDIGGLDRQVLSAFDFTIYCVTRRDYEGDNLSILSDKVVGAFTDNTTTDGLKRIPFYDAVTKVQNGAMVVTECNEGKGGLEAPDKSKFSIFTLTARMASK
jgi:hypothetical protein